MAREITYNNFEISLVVFMPNITTNHAFLYKPVVRLRAALQYCHAMLVFCLAVCSEQVAIQISICCLRKRFFVLEYCELTAMASNTVTSVSKREKVISLWSSGYQNKEICSRLHLSHQTVSNILFMIFMS